MASQGPVDWETRSHRRAGPRLEDLIPLTVVIAAGCEPCAVRMVKRALQSGSTRRQIERTLRIVEQLLSTDCFQQAVGAEAAARMDAPLAAGARALDEAGPQAEPASCCGGPSEHPHPATPCENEGG